MCLSNRINAGFHAELWGSGQCGGLAMLADVSTADPGSDGPGPTHRVRTAQVPTVPLKGLELQETTVLMNEQIRSRTVSRRCEGLWAGRVPGWGPRGSARVICLRSAQVDHSPDTEVL